MVCMLRNSTKWMGNPCWWTLHSL